MEAKRLLLLVLHADLLLIAIEKLGQRAGAANACIFDGYSTNLSHQIKLKAPRLVSRKYSVYLY